MVDIAISVTDLGSYENALVANTAKGFTLTAVGLSYFPSLTVVNHGTGPIYVRTDGTDPTVKDVNSRVVLPGTASALPSSASSSARIAVISATTGSVSIMRNLQ